MAKVHYRTSDGYYLGFYEEGECPVEGAVTVEGAPLDTRAKWVNEAWDLTEARINDARSDRNALLADTDWWANSDLTMTDEQRAYRQALRDLPAQEGFPDVTWPTKP